MAPRPDSSSIRLLAWPLARLWLLVLLLVPVNAQVGRALRAEARPGADGPSARFHLLAIGIDQYANWPRLKTAVNGARAVSKELQEHYGFEPTNTTILLDGQATRSAVVSQLRRLARELTDRDCLLIYYAGHGHIDELTQAGSWVPVEAATEGDDAPSTWIANSDIKSLLKACKARHILLISDSCYSGDFLRTLRGGAPAITDEYVRAAFALASRHALTSGGIQPVADGGADGHSVFTYFLLKALRENTHPWILPSQLHERIRGGVAANAPQQPQLGMISDTAGEIGGDFVLFRDVAGLEQAVDERQRQLTLLEQRQQDAKAAEARKAEAIAARQTELDALDEKIRKLQASLDQGAAPNGSLDQLLALVTQKETEEAELDQLRKRTEAEKQKREEQLARFQSSEQARRRTQFETEYAKYQRIRDSSAASPELKRQAWREICKTFGVTPTSSEPGELKFNGQGVTLANIGPTVPSHSAENQGSTRYPAASAANEVAILTTDAGEMVFELWPEVAPNTVENFKKLVRQGFYDGTAFHRIVAGFMVQGGDPLTKDESMKAKWGTGDPGYKIKAEFNNRKHTKGVLSMARSAAVDSGGCQFFICLADVPHLDRQYTAFGRLLKGEAVLDRLGRVACEGPQNSTPVTRQGVTSIRLAPRP